MGIIAGMSSLLSPVGRDCLSGAYAGDFVAGFREALRAGIDGWVDDDLALVGPWGFALDVIRAGLRMAGSDLMVPSAHGQWLASHIPGAAAHLLPGEGPTCRSRAATRTRCWMNGSHRSDRDDRGRRS